jgi:chemotaxis-related protein WspB
MLFLVFQLGTDRYAIEAAQVVEVLPLVNAKHIPRAPRGVAGLFN